MELYVIQIHQKFFLKNGLKKKLIKFSINRKNKKIFKKEKRKLNLLSVGRLEKQKTLLELLKHLRVYKKNG